MRIAAEVRAARVGGRRDEHAHPEGRRNRTDERDHCDAHGMTNNHSANREHREREHDIELLLDGQRPHVEERRRSPERCEVVALREDHHPVLAVEERSERVRSDAVQFGIRQLCGRDAQDDHGDGRERGQEPSDAAGPEVAERHRSRSLDLAADQAGDEKARDHEEDVDAEEARGQDRRREVIHDHCCNRDRAQAVEASDIRVGGGARRPDRVSSHGAGRSRHRFVSLSGSSFVARRDRCHDHDRQTAARV